MASSFSSSYFRSSSLFIFALQFRFVHACWLISYSFLHLSIQAKKIIHTRYLSFTFVQNKKKQFFTNSSLYSLWSINEYPNEIKRIWWWRWINLLPVNKKKSSWHCFYCFLGFGDFGAYSSDPFTSTSSPIGSDPDVDWSVFENAGMTIIHSKSFLSFFLLRTIFITWW